jgi:hypothetical protein
MYECDDGSSFVFSAEKSGNWLFLPKETLNLKKVSSYKYQLDNIKLLIKPSQAILMRGEKDITFCKKNEKISILEDLKLNGYDFVAFDDKSKWMIKMKADTLEIDFFAKSYKYKLKIVNSVNNKTLMEFKDGKIILEGNSCKSLYGGMYGTKVMMKFKGSLYFGCGEALH